jgi:AP-3 complex subunit sigma
MWGVCSPLRGPVGWQVHYILDEMIMGGLVLETNVADIVASLDALNKMEKTAPPKAVAAGPRRA